MRADLGRAGAFEFRGVVCALLWQGLALARHLCCNELLEEQRTIVSPSTGAYKYGANTRSAIQAALVQSSLL